MLSGTGEPVPLVILGMGKLGGHELNFSSDIDVIFLYPQDGETDGPRRLSAPEYFARLSQGIVRLLDEVTSDGFVFRVDTRLRPFGDSGPPVTSFAALESYLLQHGRGWERYAYVKARIVGPPPPPAVAGELVDELIRPFVYRGYLDYGIFESLREMHALIAAEVTRRELKDNVKLGPGGIREIEFIVQSLQLVRGGGRPELTVRNLQKAVPALVGRGGLDADDARTLLAAYRFLRRLENFIQALNDRQVHELPDDPTDRQRLALAMGYDDWAGLVAELDRHRATVSRQFDAIAFRDADGHDADSGIAARVETLWQERRDADAWVPVLESAGIEQAAAVAAALTAFARSTAVERMDTDSRRRIRAFLPRLVSALADSATPDVALARLLAIVEQVLRRSAYIALLNENAGALRHLVALCEKSAYLAEQVARHPMLLDELLDPRIYTMRISRGDFEAEAGERLGSVDEADSEQLIERLGQFQRANLFRIAVADFNGTLPIMRVSDCLTDLAETVLGQALTIAWQDLVRRHGPPEYLEDGTRYRAGFGILAYGKFGGMELSYASDLDLVFLHDSHGDKQVTAGPKPLENAVFFTRLVRRLVHFLTTQTGSGMLYEVDTRLRPDGRSGVLVTSVEAFEKYQDDNAWTWEHQALLRARPVAGSARIGREFERIRAETLVSRVRRDSLKEDVVAMRRRMRDNLDKGSAGRFDLKQGPGGIADIEFIVQYLVLANAARRRAVIHYPDNIRQLGVLAAAGCLAETEATGLQEIYRRYRQRLHHLSLDEKPPLVDADEFAAERRSVRDSWDRAFAA